MAEAQKTTIKQIVDEQVGRVPPHSIEIEQAVLGALMIVDELEFDYSNILKPEVFYKEAHQKIYKAIQDLVVKGEKVDLYSVKEQLLANGDLEAVGGIAYLAQLTYNVGSAAHIDYYVRILFQKYIQRELIKIGAEMQQKAYDASIDVDELLDEAEAKLFNLAYGVISSESKHIKDILPSLMEEIETIANKKETLTGVPSGYVSLDRITGGWQKSDLIIIAARPSMGKTAFVVNLARNAALDYEQPVALFTLEMPADQIATRLISIETQIPTNKLRTGQLTEDDWALLEEKVQNLINAPIIIDDTPQLSLFELRAKARRLKSKYDIKLLIVDYLQLMTVPNEGRMSREQVVSQISRGLKALAKELNIPVIALSQLNRAVELRGGDKRPQLSDLRESGAIEQDADLVIFLHRPEYYGITEDKDGESLIGITEIIIAKHRNGPTAQLKLKFNKEYGKFEEAEEQQVIPELPEPSEEFMTTITSKISESQLENPDDFNEFTQIHSSVNDDFYSEDSDLPDDFTQFDTEEYELPEEN